MIRFIDEHRERRSRDGLRWGVEPICRTLQFAPQTYYAARKRAPSQRSVRDEALKPVILEVWEENYGVYGAPKLWRQLHREGHVVARCTVERLMRELGIYGAVRGKPKRTTVAGDDAHRPQDLVDRDFTATAPNTKWVADFTYVRTRSGFVYVAFIIDCYARVIVGWNVASRMTTDLVLGALEQAIWTRLPTFGSSQRLGDGFVDTHWDAEARLIHHSDAGSQYLSIAHTEQLATAGIDPSVGSVGDSYDNALAESIIGLYKTELVDNLGPWQSAAGLELETLLWVDWWNHRRLLEPIGHIPPTEREDNHYRHHKPPIPKP